MPWLQDVPAVIHAWLPGEQFATALADVLSGREEPGGRLPITFPTDQSATPIREPHQYPGVDGVASYSEELLVGYRWYRERGVQPAFPFGHGLGYASFQLADLRADVMEALIGVSFSVRNIGSRRGKAFRSCTSLFRPRLASRPPSSKRSKSYALTQARSARFAWRFLSTTSPFTTTNTGHAWCEPEPTKSTLAFRRRISN
jgi:beta-glucosidase